jgi:integrase
MADVYDRWHKSRPGDNEQLCAEHGKPPTADHGVGKRWQVRYRDADGQQRKENFARKPDADARAKVVGANLLHGVFIDPKAGRVSLRSYSENRWLPAQMHLRPNSAELYAQHLGNHIIPLLGDRHVGALRRTDMKAFVAALRKKPAQRQKRGSEPRLLAASTVVTVYAVLRALMQSAVDDGLIPGNPCARVPLPRVEPRVLKPLTAGEVSALASAITPRYEVAVWLGAGAGLREGEALGLTNPRVRFLERRLLVEQQMQNGELSPLKTKASKRVVPLDDVVLQALTEHLARPPLRRRRGAKPLDGEHEDLVITNRCGTPVQRSSFGHCWRQAVDAAGLPAGTRFHDLRHFYASTLIAANLNPKTIQARLGHATLAETMDTYGHLFPDHEDHGRGALDAAFSALSDVPQKCPEAGR